MPTHTNAIHRILDANLNRAKEGLRVCEEVVRFIIESRTLAEEFKRIRHSLDRASKKLRYAESLLKNRSSETDVGRTLNKHELERGGYADIFIANIQRVKESIRVLEEFGKLKDPKIAIGFKRIRYDVYAIEKRAMGKIAPTRKTSFS